MSKEVFELDFNFNPAFRFLFYFLKQPTSKRLISTDSQLLITLVQVGTDLVSTGSKLKLESVAAQMLLIAFNT